MDHSKKPPKKTRVFQFHQISIFFARIGPWVGIINLGINVMWLNPYGCQAVRHKLKKGLKTLKIHF